MKRVVITQRIELLIERDEFRDCLDQAMVLWLGQLGAIPIPVPNRLANSGELDSSLQVWLDEIQPAGVLLSGGGDPFLRDSRYFVEEALITYARKLRLPLLGICRGMQRLVIASGGKLIESDNHIGVRHGITHQKHGSRSVNSFHKMKVVDLPKDWMTIAEGEDGSVEGIQHANLPWQGWMWHPEREESPDTYDQKETKMLFELDN